MDTRSSAAAACGRSQRRTPPPAPKKAAPWLVIPYGKGMKSQAFYNICDPNNTTCRKSIPELSGKSFWQKASHQNWLIIVCEDKRYESIYNLDNWKHGDCFLWNPVTLDNIRLPSLEEWISRPKNYVLVDCVLTSPPSSRHNRDDDDSVVIFLFTTPFDKKGDVLFFFCHPGDDKQWRMKRISRRNIAGDFTGKLVSVHSIKHKLYVTFDSEDRLLEFERAHLLDDNVKILSVKPFELVMGNTNSSSLGADYTDLYYVDSDDEIFKFWVNYNGKCKQVMSIEVWSLDFFSMKWEEMNYLGDNVMFAGMKTGFCCSADKLGLKSGGLYYTLPNDQSLYKFELKRGNAVILPCPNLQTPWFPSEWIIMMPEDDGKKRMQNNGEEEEQKKDFTIKESEENKACTTSDINRSNSTGCPWLMFPRDNTYNFIDPVNDKEAYQVSFCELLKGATIHYQQDGWLLMSRVREVFFHNPLTREIIKLPDLPDGYNISIICFVDAPTTPNCAVFVIDQTAPIDICILIIMRGDDIWLPIDFPYTNVKKLMPLHGTAPVLYKNGFYCVDCDGTLGAYDVVMKGGGWSVLEKPKKIFKNDMHPNMLVECGGDLLSVKIGHLGTSIRIYRLDLSEMEWVNVESLGKYMLFISETSCMSAVAPNSRMGNRIFFPRRYLKGEGILSYSLETGSYTSSSGKNQHSLNSFYETEGWLSNNSWIQPNWSKSTEQELDWLNPLDDDAC